MINAALLLIFFALAIYVLVRSYRSYRQERDRSEARYLLGWSALGVIAPIIGGMGLLVIDSPHFWDDIPVWLRLVQHAVFSLTLIGLVYSGFGFTIALTGEEHWKITHCRVVLTIAFLGKTIAEILYRQMGLEVPWYGLILFPACLFYMLLIVRKLHVHALTAQPTLKWRLSTSKWAIILCLLAPLDWWVLQPITVSWVIRPSIVLAIMSWILFALSFRRIELRSLRQAQQPSE